MAFETYDQSDEKMWSEYDFAVLLDGVSYDTRPLIRNCLSTRNQTVTRNEGFVTFPFKGMCFAKDFKIELNKSLKPNKRKHYNRGNKYSIMLLTSLRVEHSNLNAHSFKIGLDTPETSLHFLIVCPHFTEQRRTLFDRIKQNFIPKFRKLSQKSQYEILVEGYDPENPELTKINSKMKWNSHKILS